MILFEIAEKTRQRIEESKKNISLEEIKAKALSMNTDTGFPFKKALRGEDIAFICEVKKASPSKGIISEDFPYIETAKSYRSAGAAAISVLTEPYYFKGKNEYLTDISKEVDLPIIRKDFTIDEYMIYEAKVIGASAVLLICALLDDDTLKRYLDIAHSIGLSALVEAHDENEVMSAVKCGAGIIGVNNRDLKTFTVDVNNSIRLRNLVKEDIVFVSESGIKTPEDIEVLRKNKINAVLIGETLMRSENKAEMLHFLKTGAGA